MKDSAATRTLFASGVGDTKFVGGYSPDIEVNLAAGGDCGVLITASGGYICNKKIQGTYFGIISDGTSTATAADYSFEIAFSTGSDYMPTLGVH